MQHFRLLPAIVIITLSSSTLFTRADDNANQAAARAALMEQMNDTGNDMQSPTNAPVPAPQQPALTPPPVMSTPPPVAPPVAPTMPPMTNMMSAPVTPPVTQTPPPQPPPPISPNLPTVPPPIQPTSSENQLVAPPLPISADKQAQLEQLLSRYKADEITPAQYQEERTKILAQP
jgi:hypothetical protein